MATGKFEFNGTGGGYVWLVLWTSVLNILTVSLAYPWTETAKERWKAKKTYIDGRQLTFKGTGFGFWYVVGDHHPHHHNAWLVCSLGSLSAPAMEDEQPVLCLIRGQ